MGTPITDPSTAVDTVAATLTRTAVEDAAANYQDAADQVSRLKAELAATEEVMRAARQELLLALCPVMNDITALVIPYVYSKAGVMSIVATKTSSGIVVETIPRLQS